MNKFYSLINIKIIIFYEKKQFICHSAPIFNSMAELFLPILLI